MSRVPATPPAIPAPMMISRATSTVIPRTRPRSSGRRASRLATPKMAAARPMITYTAARLRNRQQHPRDRHGDHEAITSAAATGTSTGRNRWSRYSALASESPVARSDQARAVHSKAPASNDHHPDPGSEGGQGQTPTTTMPKRRAAHRIGHQADAGRGDAVASCPTGTPSISASDSASASRKAVWKQPRNAITAAKDMRTTCSPRVHPPNPSSPRVIGPRNESTIGPSCRTRR